MALNLINRIKKIETSTGNGSCQCQRPKTEVYFTRETNLGVFSEPKCSSPIPDTCDQCSRPIIKDSLTIQFVKSRRPAPQL